MKQRGEKKHWERRDFGVSFSLLTAVLFVVAAKMTSGVEAQELIPVISGPASATEETNVSAQQLLEALKNGGLSGNGNLGIETESVSETAVDSQPIPDPGNDLVQESDLADMENLNSDTFEYLEAQGGLVAGAAIAKTDSGSPTIFKLAAKFLEEVVFKNSAEFLKSAKFSEGFEVSGQPVFDRDTAGFAIIKKDSQSVEVQFEKKYKVAPVVTASLSVQQYDDPEVRAAAEDLLLVSNVNYVVTNVTREGFEIIMDHISESDIPFSWHALAVRDPNIFKKEAKGRKSDGAQDVGGLFFGGEESKSSNTLMGIIGQSTDSTSLPDSEENSSSMPAGKASQDPSRESLPGNNPSP
jgi:hypothetical protein